jgi:predicted GIY-YIG superfamily endonuclease
MDSIFISHVKAMKSQLANLLAMVPVTPTTLPSEMPLKGIYLLSDETKHLYVGRSNNIRSRINHHASSSADHHKATFAFLLAREATGNMKATYKKGNKSRSALMEDENFIEAFEHAKKRIQQMKLQFIGEDDPVRQSLLEIYVAVVLKTPYNNFDNH